MEHSPMGTSIKTEEETASTSTVYSASEVDINDLKQEPGSVQSVESGPAMLVTKEIVEYGSEDDSEQQCIQDALTSAGADGLYEANSTSQAGWNNVKPELDEMDIGPTVLQHMDIQYALNKSTVDGCSKAMRCSRVKEDKLRDYLTPHKTMTKQQHLVVQSLQRTVHERHLTSICSVHVMRLDIFQCDLCHALYTERDRLLQHIQAVHVYRPQTSLIGKFRKANKRTAADNKTTSHIFDQTTTEVDYDEAHMKSHQGEQQEDLQKHRTISSKGFKCDRTFRKQHLLSAHNNLHRRNSRKAVTARGTVPSPSDQSGLTVHVRGHTEVKPYQCTKCDARFLFSSHLIRHMVVHTGEKPYQCNICGARFARNDDLTKHVRVHTKPYHCEICDARFASNGGLARHVRVHTGEKPCQCKICGASFAQNGYLTMHMKIHTGEKHYLCRICGAKFARIGYLTVHMKIHTGEKPYQCKICDARFASNGTLTKHVIVHTGEKRYRCKICDAKFTQNGHLTRHMRIHSGKKPYQCKICRTKFTTSGNLTTHMRVHSGKRPYQCKICDAKFKTSGNLTTHMIVHSGKKPYQCKLCDAKFTTNGNLTTHMRVHSGNKPYQCKLCDAKFKTSSNLTTHFRVHSGKKPYLCKICDARFIRNSELTKHIRIHTGEKR